jgi:hypothetical protein
MDVPGCGKGSLTVRISNGPADVVYSAGLTTEQG